MSLRGRTKATRYMLDGLLSCGLCSRPFTDPRVLPCQHTFCLSCLQAVSSEKNTDYFTMFGDFRCPTCRHHTRLPEEGAAELPPDFRVGQLRDLLTSVDLLPPIGTDSMARQCDICRRQNRKRVVSSVFCLECARFMCPHCKDLHCNNRLFLNHHLVPMTEQSSSELTCPEHEESIQFVCSACGAILCFVCVFTSHRGHPISSLTTATPDQINTVRDLSAELTQSRRQFSGQSEQLQDLQNTVNSICSEARTSINAQAEAMMQMVYSNKQRLLGELEAFQKEAVAKLKAKQKEAELHIALISNACEEAEELTDAGGSLKLAAQYGSLMGRLNKLKEQLVFEPVGQDLKVAPQFVPKNDMSLGELDTYVLTCDPVMVDSVDSACFGSENSSLGAQQAEGKDNDDKTSLTRNSSTGTICPPVTRWASLNSLSTSDTKSFPAGFSWHRTPSHSYVSWR